MWDCFQLELEFPEEDGSSECRLGFPSCFTVECTSVSEGCSFSCYYFNFLEEMTCFLLAFFLIVPYYLIENITVKEVVLQFLFFTLRKQTNELLVKPRF